MALSALAWQRRRRSAAGFWRQYRRNRSGVFGLVVLLLFVGAALATPLVVGAEALSVTRAPGQPLQPPSGEFPLGTDRAGRSILDLLLWGSRVSLAVGFIATAISITIGTLVGVTAGHFGGWVAVVLMRITDWFIVLPTLVLVIALAAVMSRSLTTITVAIGVTVWTTTARLVRAQTLAVEARPYIERAKALGAGHWHVMTRHVLPNVMPIVLAQTTLLVASVIILESTLAFLGLGDPTTPSWGNILQAARQAGAMSAGLWWYILPPGIAITLVALAFTLCGRALESIINPRLRERL